MNCSIIPGSKAQRRATPRLPPLRKPKPAPAPDLRTPSPPQAGERDGERGLPMALWSSRGSGSASTTLMPRTGTMNLRARPPPHPPPPPPGGGGAEGGGGGGWGGGGGATAREDRHTTKGGRGG